MNHNNQTKAIEFIQEYPFGTICINGNELPEMGYFPFIQSLGNSPELVFECHIPKAFPIYNFMACQNATCKLVFHGENGFISAKDYSYEAASTWNFELIELVSKIELQEESETNQHLERFMNYFEQYHETDFSYSALSEEYIQKWSPHVRVFKFHILGIQIKEKMSQQLNEADFKAVTNRLFNAKRVSNQELGKRMNSKFGNKI